MVYSGNGRCERVITDRNSAEKQTLSGPVSMLIDPRFRARPSEQNCVMAEMNLFTGKLRCVMNSKGEGYLRKFLQKSLTFLQF